MCNSSICNFIPDKRMTYKICFDNQIFKILCTSIFLYCSLSKITLLLTSFSRAQNLSCIPRSVNGIFFFFFGANLLEEYHGLMESTDDSKFYLLVSTFSFAKLLMKTVTVNIMTSRSHFQPDNHSKCLV